jgi:dGTPase
LFFEGNAQSFRMVARADNRDQVYFRLTYASLGAMIKYPWCSNDERVDTNKKLSVFYSEREIFDDVVATLGLRKPNGGVIRHPLSFLSETADDICYRITDFEDAVEMRILHEQDVREIFAKIIGKDTKGPLSAMRAKAIGCFVEAAVKTFEKHYDSIMAGERDWSLALKSDFPPSMKEALHDIEEKYQYIFRHRPKVVVELGAYNILGKILGVYADAVKQLSKNHDYAKLGFIHRRCVDLAWGDVYVKVNQEQDYDWWLGRVMDFVSGMTDNYATKVAAEIQGV